MSFSFFFGPARSQRRGCPARLPVHLGVEALDDRSLPSFLAPVTSPGGGDSIAVADFNQDGRDDVVVISGNNSTSVSLSKGDGTFNKPISLGGAQGPLLYVNASDVNGDGYLDVVGTAFSKKYVKLCGIYSCSLNGTVYKSAWLGHGDGNFDPVSITSSPYKVNSGYGGLHWPSTVYNPTGAGADFNHDGIFDHASLDKDLGTISVTLRAADGSTLLTETYPAGSNPRSIMSGDFNGDGWADLVVVNGNKLSAWLNDGSW